MRCCLDYPECDHEDERRKKKYNDEVAARIAERRRRNPNYDEELMAYYVPGARVFHYLPGTCNTRNTRPISLAEIKRRNLHPCSNCRLPHGDWYDIYEAREVF